MTTTLRSAAEKFACAWRRPDAYCCACSTVTAPLAYQIGVTLFLLLREGEIGLRFGGLLFRLLDARLLRGDLRVDVDDVGFALIELRLVVTVVEPHQDRAGLDRLIVGHRHVDDSGVDLRTDRYRAGVDKGVVGGLIAAGVDPPDHEADQRDDEQCGDEEHHSATLAQPDEPRVSAPRLADRGFRFAARGGVLATLVVGALIHDGSKRRARQIGFRPPVAGGKRSATLTRQIV